MFCVPFRTVPTTLHCFSTHTLLKPFTTIILFNLINQKQLLQVTLQHVTLQHAIHLQVCALPDSEGTLIAKTVSKIVSPW